MDVTLPPAVAAAYTRADAAGFTLSCEPEVGAFLAALAAAVPEGGRILELGTGVGTGTAWIVDGLRERADVEVVSVDLDAAVQAAARRATWPPCVRFLVGDGAEAVTALGRFDLVFADAPGGKLHALEHTIDALALRGVLLVDDMDLTRHDDPELRAGLARVRTTLLGSPRLVTAELACGSGMMIGVRRC